MVTPEEVRRVAELARLELPADEQHGLVADLVAILEHFRVLQDVDTEDVAPMTHPIAVPGEGEPDEPVEFPRPRDALVSLTDHAREGFYVVPRVIADEPEP